MKRDIILMAVLLIIVGLLLAVPAMIDSQTADAARAAVVNKPQVVKPLGALAAEQPQAEDPFEICVKNCVRESNQSESWCRTSEYSPCPNCAKFVASGACSKSCLNSYATCKVPYTQQECEVGKRVECEAARKNCGAGFVTELASSKAARITNCTMCRWCCPLSFQNKQEWQEFCAPLSETLLNGMPKFVIFKE